MDLPELILNKTEAEYKQLFVSHYCNASPIITYDGLNVYFYPEMFEHSFYKRAYHNLHAPKDCMDINRCERILWIEAVLHDPTIIPFQGYDSARNCYDNSRRVAFLTSNDYLVVIRADKNNWRFTTAYIVDNPYAAAKIRSSPRWIKK